MPQQAHAIKTRSPARMPAAPPAAERSAAAASVPIAASELNSVGQSRKKRYPRKTVATSSRFSQSATDAEDAIRRPKSRDRGPSTPPKKMAPTSRIRVLGGRVQGFESLRSLMMRGKTPTAAPRHNRPASYPDKGATP